MSANPLRFSYYRTKGRVTWELSPCPIGAVTWLHLEQVPSLLQAIGPAFTKRIPDNNSSNYGRISSAVILQRDEQEGHEETCLPANLALLLGYLCASFQPPPGPSPDFSLGYQTKLHLVMTEIRLQISCKWTKRRATWSIVALLPGQCCLPTCQQVTVAPKPLAQPSLWRFHLFWAAGFVQVSSQRSSDISCQARERLLQVCQELGLQVNCRKSSLIPSQDMTYLNMQIQSVRFIANPTATWVGNLLKIIEEFLSSPDPPAALWRLLLGHLSSLTLLVKGGMLWMRCFQIRLRSWWDFRDEFLRIPWDPLYKEDPLWWSWATQQRVGVDLSLPVPDLSFYSDESDVGWGVIVGEHQVSGVWSPSHRGFSINLREMMAVQGGLLEFSSLLRGRTIALFCDIVTAVAYLRRSGGTRSQDLFLEAREILLWVESMKITLLPQLIQGSLNTRADLLSRRNLVMGSEWTLHQEVVQDLLRQWPAIIDLFATSLSARLPVFFAPAWEPQAAGVDVFLQPWDTLRAYAFPPIAIITRVLLILRASPICDLTLIAPFWPQREWFPALLDLLSDIPIELP